MSKNIVVTTGIYDMIKDHVRRKKVTREEEDLLLLELKHAKQVLRRELPDDVVTVNRRVKIKITQITKKKNICLWQPPKQTIKKENYLFYAMWP